VRWLAVSQTLSSPSAALVVKKAETEHQSATQSNSKGFVVSAVAGGHKRGSGFRRGTRRRGEAEWGGSRPR
jgi:hypothetical protein